MFFIRKWIRDFFGFSGTEINGFLILLPITAILIFSEPLYRVWVGTRGVPYSEDQKSLDSLITAWENRVEKADPGAVQKLLLFSFDPNTSDVEELMRLGFSERLSNRIAAYRLKGGVFRVKSDLMKIYGLDSTLYKQLYRYIRLPASRLILTESVKVRQSTDSVKGRQRIGSFDINTADTTLLKTVYGIGPRLAARIVKFRDGLGGFIKVGQLYEVYGLDSLVVERLLKVAFIKTDFIPAKININAADEEQLARHPYIRYKLARELINYRYQHGDFQQVSDIKKLWTIDSQDLERVLPYVKLTD